MPKDLHRTDDYYEWVRTVRQTRRRAERLGRVGLAFAFCFWWFFASFWSWGLSPLVFSDPIPVPIAAIVGGLIACLTWPVLKVLSEEASSDG
jgi:hypothetical protein